MPDLSGTDFEIFLGLLMIINIILCVLLGRVLNRLAASLIEFMEFLQEHAMREERMIEEVKVKLEKL